MPITNKTAKIMKEITDYSRKATWHILDKKRTMKRSKLWMLAAILICATMTVTTACKGGKPASEANDSTATSDIDKLREEIRAQYGENKPITDGNYDKSLAVKCINGTFVGKKVGDIISYKGIPFVGKQPVGELRWKAPVDVTPSDSVYEAYYHGKSPRQNENVTDAGSPGNVTIFGESAGSASVTLLPLIKGSHQYFKKVIGQSGTPVFTRSAEQAIACTDELMEALGCKTVSDLQKVDVDKLIEASAMLSLRVWPERDGSLLPQNPFEAYADGTAKDIDFIQGCNKDELNYFVYCFGGAEAYNQWGDDRKAKKMAELTDEEKALVESFCKDIKGESYERTSRLFDQIVFIAPLFRLTENQTKAGGKSYNYFFTPESSLPIMRCGHAVEVAVVLNHPENTSFTGRAFDETFSKTMRRMWVQFAKTGCPSLTAEQSPDGKAKEWPLYDLKDKKVMILDEQDIHPEKESERKILDWERTYFLTKYYCI